MASLNETPGSRRPRLPLLHLHGTVTRYKNELFTRKEELEEENSENPSKVDKDYKIADLELKCLLSLQKRKDRALSGVLESSDFLSPRSGCLTPLSSARGPIIGVQQKFPQERVLLSKSLLKKAGGHIQCHIRRVVSTYKLYPRYKLYLTKGNIFLLSARKRKRSKCSNYILSLDEEDASRRTGNYFGNKLRSYCLNFHGRATHASVKNFQLVTEFDNEHVLLQLGKMGKNYFTMDYCYPLSALQAFSIVVSTLDRKFA